MTNTHKLPIPGIPRIPTPRAAGKKFKHGAISVSQNPEYTDDCLEDYFDDNNGYTSKVEAILSEKAQHLFGLRWMSIVEARVKRRKDFIFKIPMNIFSGLVGMGSLYSLANSIDNGKYTFFTILLDCIAITSTILTASYTAYNPQQKSENLTNMAAKYNELFNKIQNCLIMDQHKRPPADHFIELINTELEHCMENGIAPLVTEETRRKYSIELKKSGKNYTNPFGIAEIHIKSPAKFDVNIPNNINDTNNNDNNNDNNDQKV